MDDFFEEQSLEDVGSIDFMKYLRGIIKRWWIVVGFFILGSVLGYMNVKNDKPMYYSEAWISFDNVQSAITEQQIRSRIAKLQSRSFAEEATARLGLTLEIIQESDSKGLFREDVFSTFSTNRNPARGLYQLRIVDENSCYIYYEGEQIEARPIQSCIADTVSLNGIKFTLNPDIVKRAKIIQFNIKDFQFTVRRLVSREQVRAFPDGSQMKIALTDENPKIAARTANMLAELFIKKSEDLLRDVTRFNRVYLQDQLAIVKNDLDASDSKLKLFRSTHLQGLDNETQETVRQMNNLQTQINQIKFQKNELNSLLNRLDPNHPSFDQNVSMASIYREICEQPVFENDIDMKLEKDGLANLTGQKRDLIKAGRPEVNPEVREISERIFLSEENVQEMAVDKIKELDQTISNLNTQVNNLQARLNRLPEEEVQLIRLQRDRQANEALYNTLLSRFKGAEITDQIPVERVSIYDPAIPNYQPVNANKRQVFFLFVLGSFFLGMGVALVLEMADKSVRSTDDVSHHLRLKILGSIPRVKFDSYELQDSEKAKSISSQIVTHDYSPTPVGESYRALRTSLLFSKSIGSIRTLVISSAAPGEGKSFTAANLTITMAQQKSKTLLIDADLRRGVLHNTFNCKKKPGLTNYLTGVASLEDVLQETYIPNLSLIACGSMIPNPSELLGSERMQKFVEGISKRFDMIVFDTPPLLAASDAVILGTMVDGVAMVVRTGQTHRDTIKRKLELFQNVQARVLGAILNCAGVEVAHEGYSYYSY